MKISIVVHVFETWSLNVQERSKLKLSEMTSLRNIWDIRRKRRIEREREREREKLANQSEVLL